MSRRRFPSLDREDGERPARGTSEECSGEEQRAAGGCTTADHDGNVSRAFVHAIRDPLNGARLHATFLQRKLERWCAEDDLLESVDLVIREIDAAARLVHDIEGSLLMDRSTLHRLTPMPQAAHDASYEHRKDGKHDDHVPEDERYHPEACSGRR